MEAREWTTKVHEIDDKDNVSEISVLPQSSVGSPFPVVVAREHDVLLSYCIETVSEAETVAIVKFEGCYAHLFGPPNDEALSGHALYKRGLKPYSAFEIENSSWVKEYERMNSVHPRHDKDAFKKGKRHFIFTFHDSTFECIARDFKVEVTEVTKGKLMDTILKQSLDDCR